MKNQAQKRQDCIHFSKGPAAEEELKVVCLYAGEVFERYLPPPSRDKLLAYS